MLLYFTNTSPFVRKVLVAAHEVGLIDQIETTFLRPTPIATDATLSRANPLSKIPALILDDGTAIYDSAVICEYLDTRHKGGVRLLPADGPERWRTLRVQALCDGILEAAVLVFYERSQRPKELHWEPWISGQTAKALQGLDALESEVDAFGDDVRLSQICAAVTIGWLEFRNVLGDIRVGRPKLEKWYDAFRSRPSMRDTAPQS